MRTVLYYGSTTQIHSGASQWMYRLADMMRSEGFRTVAVLPGKKGIAEWYRDAGVTTEYLNYAPVRRRSPIGQLSYAVRAVFMTAQLAVLLWRRNADILHVNEVIYLPGLLGGYLSGAKTVCHVRVCFESYLLRWLFGTIAVLFADEVVCVSHRTRQLMFESIGYAGSNIQVVYDGVPDPERFDSRRTGDEFRDEYGIDEDATVVMSLSKLVEIKGQRRVIRAARRMTSRNIEFVIVGGKVEGHEKYARELSASIDGLDSVRMTGFHSDITEALAAADVFVHVPTNEDPFPGVVLEAMLSETPVIGSYSGGIPEQVVNNETGYIVSKHGGEEEVIDRINRLVENRSRRERMGRAGRDSALRRLPYDRHFEEIAGVYSTI